MVSIFNPGEPDDDRVPDGGLFRPDPDEVYASTAALIVEVRSSGDDTREKVPFYAAHGVDEVLIVDPDESATPAIPPGTIVPGWPLIIVPPLLRRRPPAPGPATRRSAFWSSTTSRICARC
jgi:Uma2 family endonuclease